MKTSTTQARTFRRTISKIVMALAVASVMGGIAMTPAHGKGNDNRQGHQDKGLHKGERQGNQRPVYQPAYQAPYYYSQPVYAPPPVYYAPPQSPGISFFFPLDIRF